MELNKKKEILNVTQAAMPPFDEYVEMIRSIWDTKWMTNMGELHNRLESMLMEYMKADSISLFVNGHMALEMVLQAMNLSGEVITTPFTFVSTTHAIVRNGLTPVFCEVKEDDYTMDTSQIEKLITPRTTAILPVHVYGNICNIEEIERIAKKHNLKVIYDAAHAFGVTYQGKNIATYGDASMLSFHATKVFNTIEGGAVVYKDKELGRSLYTLKNFGIKSPECVDGIGGNAKMNEFQAAMGICNLKYIERDIQHRKEAVEHYISRLEKTPGLKLPCFQEDVKSNYSYFPVIFNKDVFGLCRDDIYEKLKEHNIIARKYFYPLITDMDCYCGTYDSYKTPIAKKIADSVLTLPLSAAITSSQIDEICDIILEK